MNGLYKLSFIVFFVSSMLTIVSLPAFAQEARGELLYSENFDNDQALGWNLDQRGWNVDAGMLTGQGHFWAEYNLGNWDTAILRFRLQTNGMHANVRNSDIGRYAIGFRVQQDSLVLYLFKQLWPDNFSGDLATNTTGLPARAVHRVEIRIEGGLIQVRMNNRLMINYTDPDPLPPGSIAFETLENGFAQIDDIMVYGSPVQGDDPVPPVTPGPKPDLIIQDVSWDLNETDRILELHVTVQNTGNLHSPPCEVQASAFGWDPVGSTAQLGPGHSEVVTFIMEIPENSEPERYPIEVYADPSNEIVESDEDNNSLSTFIGVSGMRHPNGRNGFPWNWILYAILFFGTGTILGRVLTKRTRMSWKRSSQLQWQLEATTELPEPAEACRWACKARVTTDLLKHWKVVSMKLTPQGIPARKKQSTKWVKGDILSGLNEAAQIPNITEDKDRILQDVAPIADTMVEKIMEWKTEGHTPASVKVDARLKRNVKCEFRLYHCERTGTELNWVDTKVKWKGSLNQPGGKFLGILRGPTALESDFPNRARGELEEYLLQLIKGIRLK